MRETWRKVQRFPHYQVSNLGRVRKAKKTCFWDHSPSGRILRQGTNLHGYLTVHLRTGAGHGVTVTVHSIVAVAFHGRRPSRKHEVAHGNGNKRDARESNLRWATRSENIADRVRHGSHNRGNRHWNAIFNEQQVREMRRLVEGGVTISSLSRLTLRSVKTIQEIVNRRTWAHL